MVWGCEKFHIYLCGAEFELLSDHKPLEVIYSPKSKPPPRIQRWALRLQPYNFKLRHIPGATNPADMLSRSPMKAGPYRDNAEEFLCNIISHAIPRAITVQSVLDASHSDTTLQQVRENIQCGRWKHCDATAPFFKVRHELSIKNDIVVRGSRIVMPTALRQQTLQLSHEGHQGIVKTKQLLRTKVWWPGIDMFNKMA